MESSVSHTSVVTVNTLLYLPLVFRSWTGVWFGKRCLALVGTALSLSQVQVSLMVVVVEWGGVPDVTPGDVSRDPAQTKPALRPIADQFRSSKGLRQDSSKICHVFAS